MKVTTKLTQSAKSTRNIMIFRLSQKLNTKVKAGTLNARPLDENPFADWSAHSFTADRKQYILLCNTKSLYSTVIYGKGIADDRQFINRACEGIREFMQDDGQQHAFHRFIAPASAKVLFAKALNRSVTGSMNELIFQATLWLTEDGYSPHDIGFQLNDIMISSLAGAARGGYGRPRDAFKRLLHADGA